MDSARENEKEFADGFAPGRRRSKLMNSPLLILARHDSGMAGKDDGSDTPMGSSRNSRVFDVSRLYIWSCKRRATDCDMASRTSLNGG